MFAGKGLLLRPMAYASLFTIAAASKDETTAIKQRPCDLPLYDIKTKECCTGHDSKQVTGVRKYLQDGVEVTRVNVCQGYQSVASETKRVEQFFETGKEHSKFAIDYLNEPGNSIPRAGAITIGGLSGYIIGLRHGFIRRFMYTTIGAGAIASLCYPKEADYYAQKTLAEAKIWSTIAYNFVYGIKPGDEAKSIELPASVAKTMDTINNAFQSLKDMVSSKK